MGKITVAEILQRTVEDPSYLEAWKQIKKIVGTNKRYSFRAWLFCHQLIEKAEEMRKELRVAQGEP